MSASFVISTPTVNDAARLALIDETAYDSNPMRNTLSAFQSATPDQQAEHLKWSAESLGKRLEQDDSGIFYKATDQSTGTIAAWMELKKPDFEGPKAPATDTASQKGEEEQDAGPKPNFCWRLDKVEKFLKMWEDARKRNMGESNDYWCLAKLVVDPEYQRRGVGRILLTKALQTVDLSGLSIYTGSTPAAEKLALDYGFKVLEEVRCDGIPSHVTIMLRGGKNQIKKVPLDN